MFPTEGENNDPRAPILAKATWTDVNLPFIRVTLNSVLVLRPQPVRTVRRLLVRCQRGTSQRLGGSEGFPGPCRCCPHGVNVMLSEGLGLVC